MKIPSVCGGTRERGSSTDMRIAIWRGDAAKYRVPLKTRGGAISSISLIGARRPAMRTSISPLYACSASSATAQEWRLPGHYLRTRDCGTRAMGLRLGRVAEKAQMIKNQFPPAQARSPTLKSILVLMRIGARRNGRRIDEQASRESHDDTMASELLDNLHRRRAALTKIIV